ncbi:MAG: hypothetical protein BMS9Abin12_1739 [Acidimicrobiia bacterium]|nr:MAG: hypothetical protein BMS9Abin12_1739 [Acidimicrobiia bacterium]
MADDVSPSKIRARGFEVVRRGYDRAAIDTYLSSLADEIERLSGKLEDRTAKELKVGLDDPGALALELGAIGGEVASILEAARAAADGMRSRAAADVDQWRSSTESETQRILTDTTEQSQSMRAAAWNEGSSMLSSALAQAKSLVDAAREDALFIRAEAEREAIRLTGDAKRDREESIRTARMEAEQLLNVARNESDGILAAANRQAEQAQERARVLEDRRTELLTELESARASIGHLEEEIESKRLALETPEIVPEDDVDALSHHRVDGGSVRIVAPSRSMTLKPVDAEELVADVVALRTGKTLEAEQATPTHQTETVTVIAPPQPPTVEEIEPESTDEESVAVPVEPEPKESVSGDEIGSLFASLRDNSSYSLQEGRAGVGSEEDSEPASPTKGDQPDIESESVSPVEDEEPEVPHAKLIPLQNSALKDIKRSLVDLQNDALEHLRTDVGWVPSRTFTNRFKAPFSELAMEITGSKDDGGAAKLFNVDLHGAVTGAIGKARDAGAGERQVASSVSRVFRMWRADEAERRVVDAAQELSSRR